MACHAPPLASACLIYGSRRVPAHVACCAFAVLVAPNHTYFMHVMCACLLMVSCKQTHMVDSYPSMSFRIATIPIEMGARELYPSTCHGTADPRAGLAPGVLLCRSWPAQTEDPQWSLHSAKAAWLPATWPQLVCSTPHPACGRICHCRNLLQ